MSYSNLVGISIYIASNNLPQSLLSAIALNCTMYLVQLLWFPSHLGTDNHLYSMASFIFLFKSGPRFQIPDSIKLANSFCSTFATLYFCFMYPSDSENSFYWFWSDFDLILTSSFAQKFQHPSGLIIATYSFLHYDHHSTPFDCTSNKMKIIKQSNFVFLLYC